MTKKLILYMAYFAARPEHAGSANTVW